MAQIAKIAIVLTAIFCIVAPSSSFAIVTGDGTLSFSFSDNPDYVQTSGHARVEDFPGSSTDVNGSSASTNDGHNFASVNNGGVATTTFSFTAKAPNSATGGWVQTDTWGSFLYGGRGSWYGPELATLPAFSFTYNLQGQTDSPGDYFGLNMQLEVGYQIQDPDYFNDYKYDDGPRTTVYTAYTQNSPNAIHFPDVNGNFSGSGTVNIGPYTALPYQPAGIAAPMTNASWWISWDFGGAGYDKWSGQTESVVPEPATMVLFGLGSAAMAFIRKRKSA